MKADVLMGLQYGSEGKGFLSALLAKNELYDAYIRSGGPNAGHCILHQGVEYKMRQIPCGWIDPRADLLLGPAMVIRLDVLKAEIEEVESHGFSVRGRLYVHEHATIITDAHMAEEMETIRGAIGSTAEGVGAARRGKMTRISDNVELASSKLALFASMGIKVIDRSTWVASVHGYERVMLEGTQGAGLCITHGQYPYCTSWPCTTGQILSDAGIAPASLGKVYGVVRTKPIRVAGNSGPLKGETTFQDLGQPEEHTTVTKKVRRIAADIDWDELDMAIAINGPTDICLTFGDYLKTADRVALIAEIETRYGVPVSYVGLGPAGEFHGRHGVFAAIASGQNPTYDPGEALDGVWAELKPFLLAKREKYGTDNINVMGEAGILTRCFDKVNRLKTVLIDRHNEVTDDEDPWWDLAGYSMIALVRRKFGRW